MSLGYSNIQRTEWARARNATWVQAKAAITQVVVRKMDRSDLRLLGFLVDDRCYILAFVTFVELPTWRELPRLGRFDALPADDEEELDPQRPSTAMTGASFSCFRKVFVGLVRPRGSVHM